MKLLLGTTAVLFILLLMLLLSTIVPQIVYQITHLLP